MRINVIETPSINTFDYLVFPDQHQGSQNYIVNQLTSYIPSLTEVGRRFMESAKTMYEQFQNSDMIRMAKATIRAAKGITQPNTIRYLDNLEDLQTAQPYMQRFIMAYPDLREIYHEQRCDGYSDTYIDVHPNDIGEQHYDYRRVMDGMVVETVDESGKDQWHVTQYSEDLLSGDRELSFDEKADITLTWDTIRNYLSSRDDPTNIFGGQIAG